jgi:hypothetical protein
MRFSSYVATAVFAAAISLSYPINALAADVIFQCYGIKPDSGKVDDKEIEPVDQFGKSLITLGLPVLLCAPTMIGKVDPEDKNTHLLCYEEKHKEKNDPGKTAKIENQFGTITATIEDAKLLCVPSKKTIISK